MSHIVDEASIAPLFVPSRRLDLGESDTSIETYPAFAAGSMLGLSHALGGFHPDLHREHAIFEPLTGLNRVIDTDFYVAPPSPRRAAADMVTPFLSFPAPEFDSLLRGCIAATYATARNSGGYVDELLSRLGVQPAFDPRPRAFSFDPGRVLSCLGWTINSFGSRFVVGLQDKHQTVDTDEDFGPAVVQLLCVLLLLDVNCRALRDYRPPAGASSEAFSLQLFWLIHLGSRPASWATPTTSASCAIVVKLEAAFRTLSRDPNALQPGVCLTALTMALTSLEPAAVEPFVSGLVDWCDFLALVADDSAGTPAERFQLSLNAAQCACILLQVPCVDARTAEIRCSTLSQRHNWLHALRLSNEPVDGVTVWRQLIYFHSRALTFLRAFEHSKADTSANPLHSLRWKALMLSRRGLIALSRSDAIVSRRANDIDLSLQLGRAFAQLAVTAIAEGTDSFMRFGGGSAGDLLLDEMELLTGYCCESPAEGATSDAVRERLLALSRLYRGDQWPSLEPRGIWALWR